MADSGPKRHHYAPRFYLEYFAIDAREKEPGFWIYDKSGKAPRQATSVNTAVQKDFYSFVRPDGTKDLSLEVDLFSRVEGWTKPILERLKERPALSPGDFENVTLFMALLHVRVPRMVRAMQEFDEKFMVEHWKAIGADPKAVESMWQHHLKISPNPAWKSMDEMREQLINFDKYFTVKGDEKFALITSIKTVEPIHKELMKLHPKIALAPKGTLWSRIRTAACRTCENAYPRFQ